MLWSSRGRCWCLVVCAAALVAVSVVLQRAVLTASLESVQQATEPQAVLLRPVARPSVTWTPTACIDNLAWLVPWAKMTQQPQPLSLRPRRGSLVLVDVGANKGYAVAEWLRVLSDVSFAPSNLIHQLTHLAVSEGITRFCGSCCECMGPVSSRRWARPIQPFRNITVYAYDGADVNTNFLWKFFSFISHKHTKHNSNVDDILLNEHSDASAESRIANPVAAQDGESDSDSVDSVVSDVIETVSPRSLAPLLSNSRSFFFQGVTSAVTVKVMHKAVSSQRAWGYFTRVGLGQETGSLPSERTTKRLGVKRKRPVQIVKLDDELQGAYVDILLSDVEGHDYHVFRGAEELFSQGKVGIYIFEMGGTEKHTLQMLHELRSYNYSCFLHLEDGDSGTEAHAGGPFTAAVPLVVNVFEAIRLRTVGAVNISLRGWENCMCVHEPTQARLAFFMKERSKETLSRGQSISRQLCAIYDYVANETGAMYSRSDGRGRKAWHLRNHKWRALRREARARVVDKYFSSPEAQQIQDESSLSGL